MVQERDILVGSIDRETVRAAGWNQADPDLLARQLESLRLGVLFSARQALVPAGGYFEAPGDRSPFAALRPSLERGQIALHGFGAKPHDYVATKLDHWRGSESLRAHYEGRAPVLADGLERAAWRPKNQATDSRLLVNWNAALTGGAHPLVGTWIRAGYSLGRASRAVAAIPGDLEGTAVLTEHVAALMPERVRRVWSYRDEHALRVHLALGFFESYLEESAAMALVDTMVGVQDGIFPRFTTRLGDQRLRELLGALGVREVLLRQMGSEEFARLAESQAWRCLRPELMVRAFEHQPFNGREIKAMWGARKVKRRERAGKVSSLESLLARQHEALETTNGATARPVREALGRLGEAMVAGAQPQPFRGELGRTMPPSAQRLIQMLDEVLECSTVGEARRLVERLDVVLGQYGDMHATGVAEMVVEREELSEKARRLPESVKTALINFGTGTSSSVVGQGLMMALKTLGA